MSPELSRGRDIVEITNRVLPQVGLIAVAIIMALLLIGLLGGEANGSAAPFPAGLQSLLLP